METCFSARLARRDGKCSYRGMPWDFWLIFLFLSLVIPWRGYTRLQKLLARPSVDTREKVGLYAVTIAFQWVLAGLVAWRSLARGLTMEDLGLSQQNGARIVVGAVAGAVLIGGLQWLNLRRIGRMEGEAPELLRKLANRLLPVNLLEYLPYAALAITAGVCEEFVYRGFAVAAFSQAGLPLWLVVIVSSMLFGLAHAYQGRSGIISTGTFGVILALGRVWFGNLVPVMIWHAGLDLAAGIAAPKYLLKKSVPCEIPKTE
jgi:CAAX protease family protein